MLIASTHHRLSSGPRRSPQASSTVPQFPRPLFLRCLSVACVCLPVLQSIAATGAEWNPRQPFLKTLVTAVPSLLRAQDPATGRFGRPPWNCEDQNLIFPLAAAWAIKDPANRYYHDPRVLEAVMKGGDALVAAQDKRGLWEFRKKDNSTWGRTAQPWTYSRWIRAFQLIKEAMPAQRRQHWEQGLKLGFGQIAHSLAGARSHNKTCHLAMALYCAGVCFERQDWQQDARRFLAKVVAAQSPNGYWSEHSVPVVTYNFVYVDALGVYYAMSHDATVLEALRRAARFHTLFTYPNGAEVETIDERNPFHPGVAPGNVGFSWTPEGRAFLARQQALGWKPTIDTAAAFLLYGGTGPAAALAGAGPAMAVFGDDQALVWRRQPWFICLSAFVAGQATNRWIQDRQNFASIYHDRAGLVVGGGNTKLQPFWSNFTVGDTRRLRHRPGDEHPDFLPKGDLVHVPSWARLHPDKAAPSLTLGYGPEECRLTVRPLDEKRLKLVCEASDRSHKAVEAHITFLPSPSTLLRTAAGKCAPLDEGSIAWSGTDLGAWFQYGKVRASVPPGARLLWPTKRHNPYKKDGSSTLEDARLVLCLPLSSSVPRQEVTLEISEPAGQH